MLGLSHSMRDVTYDINSLLLTDALVGFSGRCPSPGAIVVEGLTLLTIHPGRVVFTVARQLTILVRAASRRMPVTLAAPSHGEITEGVVVAGTGPLFHGVLVAEGVEAVEDDLHIGSCHPVLEYRAVVKVIGGGSALEGAERHPGPAVGVDVAVRVRTQSFLFVSLGDRTPSVFRVHLSA